MSQFTLSPGYRTNFGMTFYVPSELTFLGYNLETTKNFARQCSLGLGIGYDLSPKDRNLALEVFGGCTSTILNADVDYLSPRIDFRFGYKGEHCGYYSSLGVTFISPYSDGFKRKLLFCFSFGCWIF